MISTWSSKKFFGKNVQEHFSVISRFDQNIVQMQFLRTSIDIYLRSFCYCSCIRKSDRYPKTEYSKIKHFLKTNVPLIQFWPIKNASKSIRPIGNDHVSDDVKLTKLKKTTCQLKNFSVSSRKYRISWETMDSRAKFVLCAVGIFVCYFYFGILQERM